MTQKPLTLEEFNKFYNRMKRLNAKMRGDYMEITDEDREAWRKVFSLLNMDKHQEAVAD